MHYWTPSAAQIERMRAEGADAILAKCKALNVEAPFGFRPLLDVYGKAGFAGKRFQFRTDQDMVTFITFFS